MSRKHAIFILDNDEQARKASARLANLNDVKILHLKPTFTAMLDLEKIFMNGDRFHGLPEDIGSIDDQKFLHEVELAVLKRGPIGSNTERLTQIIDEFLSTDKYEEFVFELKSLIDSDTPTS